MGAFLGASYGSQSASSSSSGTKSTTYSPEQMAAQYALGQAFNGLVPSLATGANPANVTAAQTGAADSINKTSSGLQDRMTRMLASRGLGASGQTGKVALQGELGRESGLAANNANFANIGLNYGQNLLQNALLYAFNGIGETQQNSGTSSGSGWGISGGVGVGKS